MRRPDQGNWPFEDIVDLPHHVSDHHPPMPLEKRAAQFAPFASLVGYGDVIEETARVTDDMVELSEGMLEQISRSLAEAASERRPVGITYFVPDERKAGGAYRTVEGRIRRVERGIIILEGGERIAAERVIQVITH